MNLELLSERRFPIFIKKLILESYRNAGSLFQTYTHKIHHFQQNKGSIFRYQ